MMKDVTTKQQIEEYLTDFAKLSERDRAIRLAMALRCLHVLFERGIAIDNALLAYTPKQLGPVQ